MINKIIFILSVSILPLGTSIAIDVGDITETINSDKEMLSKEIKNTVSTARLVNLNVQKISSPMEEGSPLTMSSDEILSTPANLILPGEASDIFKIIYNGPADDTERYYRLNWQDDPVSSNGSTTSNKSAVATTSATISTILVVAPRLENFNYQYNNGVVKNTGNSSFRVVASGPCLTSQSKHSQNGVCRERYYLMPNLKVKMQRVNTTNKKTTIGIWHKEEFIIAK